VEGLSAPAAAAAPPLHILAQAQAVRASIARSPGIMQLPAANLEVYARRDFLTKEECDGLIALIDADREPSGILSDNPDPDFRTSESCNLNPHLPFVKAIEAKIAALTGIEAPYGETIQGQRYAVGQQFKAHHDFFHSNTSYWEAEQKAGGQRTWTAMIFLNAPEAGGQTFFPKAELRVAPRRGNLLLWNNLDPDGLPNLCSLHQGMPVEAGLKYVVTKWYRERPWTPPPRPSSYY
jgi:prolyl 4-hydroxylase